MYMIPYTYLHYYFTHIFIYSWGTVWLVDTERLYSTSDVKSTSIPPKIH